MDSVQLTQLLQQLQNGQCSTQDAHEKISRALLAPSFEDLGFACVDHHRAVRQGFPEVIYCAGKTPEQVAQIAARIQQQGNTLLATRASKEVFSAVHELVPGVQYHSAARLITAPGKEPLSLPGTVGVLCAGTSDLPVGEEVAVSLETMGGNVQRIYDVGVAGLHRLLARLDEVRACNVVIVCAGMEGALPSVVGGLVEVPVIAVPTSVGYGASFGGVAALLGMLNTCASGIAVVNIDNGFGAAAFAASILRQKTST